MLSWTSKGWEDYLYWQTRGEKRQIKRINNLIKDVMRNPFEGIGKPEALKDNLTGYWSRRIDAKNRLIYSYENKQVIIFSCKDHY
ncbi:Txe/YoeB family addiction module toxin [Lactobacillus sp. PV037]|uniref:Txe/YoeB family addiction module toxin n=1 Tax=unclassified Lactobacillus TaxID=2620435 RepID=UPI003A100810|nr:Txe/YoeB family addiction module toxin [Lactobacillus sp. PV012]QNQ83134.1 Txe/YoeB family addiction module toxin [Lactobacillus sp. PV037]